jgi:acetylornithine/succinyldiaminopimelate/putrescine aminotransferase
MLDSLATLTHLYTTSDVWDPGAHIGTFRGNQLAFAAGAAAVYRVSIGVPTTVGA